MWPGERGLSDWLCIMTHGVLTDTECHPCDTVHRSRICVFMTLSHYLYQVPGVWEMSAVLMIDCGHLRVRAHNDCITRRILPGARVVCSPSVIASSNLNLWREVMKHKLNMDWVWDCSHISLRDEHHREDDLQRRGDQWNLKQSLMLKIRSNARSVRPLARSSTLILAFSIDPSNPRNLNLTIGFKAWNIKWTEFVRGYL